MRWAPLCGTGYSVLPKVDCKFRRLPSTLRRSDRRSSVRSNTVMRAEVALGEEVSVSPPLTRPPLQQTPERSPTIVPGTKFLRPSGPYQVAVADMEPDVENGTIVRLYYPCGLASDGEGSKGVACEAAWLPSWRYAQGYGDYMKVPAALAVPVLMLATGWQRMPCALNRPLFSGSADVREATNPVFNSELPTEPASRFPVVIFSHGLAGMRTTYSALCMDFASAGYCVAAVEHRDGSACCTFRKGTLIPHRGTTPESEAADGSLAFRRSQLSQRVAEIEAARAVLCDLDAGQPPRCLAAQDGNRFMHATSFAGRLDMEAVVVAGHSFGAATALSTAMKSRPGRYAAVIAYDAWLYALSPADIDDHRAALPPTLFINNEKFQWRSNLDKMLRFFPLTERSLGKRAPARPRSPSGCIATLLGAGHMSQSDFPLLMGRLLKWTGVRSDLCAIRLLDLNRRLGHSFLERHVDCPHGGRASAAVDDGWLNDDGATGLPPDLEITVLEQN